MILNLRYKQYNKKQKGTVRTKEMHVSFCGWGERRKTKKAIKDNDELRERNSR